MIRQPDPLKHTGCWGWSGIQLVRLIKFWIAFQILRKLKRSRDERFDMQRNQFAAIQVLRVQQSITALFIHLLAGPLKGGSLNRLMDLGWHTALG